MNKEYLGGNDFPKQNVPKKPSDNKNIIIFILLAVIAVLLAVITAVCVVIYFAKNQANDPNKDADTSVSEMVTRDSGENASGIVINDGLEGITFSKEKTDPTSAESGSTNPAQSNSDSADSGSSAADMLPVQSGIPENGVQTLEYFNTAINKVKTSASSVEQKYVKHDLAGSPRIPGSVAATYKMLGGDTWLDDMLQNNSQGAATLKSGDIKAKFPVEGERYASRLTASDVKSAVCMQSDDVYIIVITTNSDAKSSSHNHGTGHNPKAFNVILPGTVNENVPGVAKSIFGEATVEYPSSKITVTVDAKTGNVLTAKYDLRWTINFDKVDAVLPFKTTSEYKINW